MNKKEFKLIGHLAVFGLMLVPNIASATVVSLCFERGLVVAAMATFWPVLLISRIPILGDLLNGIYSQVILLIISVSIVILLLYFIGRYIDKKTGRLSLRRLKGFRFIFVISYFLIVVLVAGAISGIDCFL